MAHCRVPTGRFPVLSLFWSVSLEPFMAHSQSDCQPKTEGHASLPSIGGSSLLILLQSRRSCHISKVSLISLGRYPFPKSRSALFFIAGHGSQSRDASGDEADGMNETLCPTDFQQAGQIIDDEINQALINLVPQGVSPVIRCNDDYLEASKAENLTCV